MVGTVEPTLFTLLLTQESKQARVILFSLLTLLHHHCRKPDCKLGWYLQLCHFEIFLIYKELGLTIVPFVQGWVGFFPLLLIQRTRYWKQISDLKIYKRQFLYLWKNIQKRHSFNTYVHSFNTIECLLFSGDSSGHWGSSGKYDKDLEA